MVILKMVPAVTAVLCVLQLSLTSAAVEHLPALSQRVIDVSLSPRPSSLAAITISTTLQDSTDSQTDGNIYFSTSYSGHLNTWNLNLTQEKLNNLVLRKHFVLNQKF